MTVSLTEPQGIVFDIQRLSLNDGPGIRTSIFFKGCPLRCQWCHNPESYIQGSQLMFHPSRCVGCGACETACPNGVHAFLPQHVLKRSQCTVCGKCVDVCCYDALSVVGHTYRCDELIRQIEGDRPYYQHRDSDGKCGGITLTGGEPMMQFPFILELAKRIQDVSVCMETSGFAPLENYRQIAPYIDLFLWDWKVSDPQKHLQLCGQSNALIQSNLEAMYHAGAEIVLRLPLIPGVNDEESHLQAVAEWLQSHPRVRKAQIMAYHRLGVDKAEQLGMPRQPVDQATTERTTKEAWLSYFHKQGLEFVAIG